MIKTTTITSLEKIKNTRTEKGLPNISSKIKINFDKDVSSITNQIINKVYLSKVLEDVEANKESGTDTLEIYKKLFDDEFSTISFKSMFYKSFENQWDMILNSIQYYSVSKQERRINFDKENRENFYLADVIFSNGLAANFYFLNEVHFDCSKLRWSTFKKHDKVIVVDIAYAIAEKRFIKDMIKYLEKNNHIIENRINKLLALYEYIEENSSIGRFKKICEKVRDNPKNLLLNLFSQDACSYPSIKLKGLYYSISSFLDIAIEAFKYSIEDLEDLEILEKEITDSSKDYARTFMTKKNIPEKIVAAMDKSKFNEFFNDIEFDADTDLDKVKLLEEEFIKLVNIFDMKNLKCFNEDNKLFKVRKLGQHHAAGIYYPLYNCLAIDMDSPSSFIHEFGHMIDSKEGDIYLNQRQDFFEIKKIYKDRISKNPEGKDLEKSKSKYNLAYYKKNTEIFARCFEIYCTRILKLDSNLCNSNLSEFPYPSDKVLENHIENYFNKLFKISKENLSEKLA